MIDALRQLETDARAESASLADRKALEDLKIKYLGRKGLFASVSGRIGEVAPEARREAGAEMNRVKKALEELFAEKERALSAQASGPRESVDFSMPGTFREPGSIHPVSRVIEEVSLIFERLGFEIADGYEIEDEYHNFQALNIPLNHPARDGFDTFYLENGRLLRSQTSTVQIRYMATHKPPLKIVAPGKVFRPDATDATHSFMFHQIEGLCVDEGIRFSDLKGVLFAFAKEYFGSDAKLRFRPHFFPFTEPSAEVDLWWEGRGWLEILGAGMVHPNVLKAVKIDPEKYTGFAFGMGVERMAMLKYGIDDIRLFFENDVRFLKQF